MRRIHRVLGLAACGIPWLLAVAACEPDPGDCDPSTITITKTVTTVVTGTDPGPDDPSWGFADLHAHPAIQYAFGADDSGEHGMVFGRMGGRWDDDTLVTDLPACDGDKHGDSYDPVNDAVKAAAFGALDGSTGGNHLKGGWPELDGWPSAQSVTHQQMHTQMVRRAWEGGMRLMVASATDNRLLSTMWTIQSWSTIFDQLDQGDYDSMRDWDKASAEAQLDAIHRWVDDNSDWMRIVTSAEDLEDAMAKGQLGVLLALEMDSLSAEDILELRESQDVRLVTPIHLANNPGFGGMAVYSDLFNASNATLRGDNVTVEDEPGVRWRYMNPVHLAVEPTPVPLFPFAAAISVTDGASCDLDYELCDAQGDPAPHGAVNTEGLNADGDSGIRDLFRAGMIVDLAHMSDKSQDAVLKIAEQYDMPVVDTHTDLRPGSLVGAAARKVSERSLSERHLTRIGNLGGMIGLGTEGDLRPQLVERRLGSPIRKLTANSAALGSYTWTLDQPRLYLGILTGDDNVESKSTLELDVTDISGEVFTTTLTEQGDDGPKEIDTFGNHERDWLTVDLPVGWEVGRIADVTLRLVQEDPGCQTYCDNWKLEGFELYWVGREDARRLYSGVVEGRYLHYFKANNDADGSPEWSVPIAVDDKRVALVEVWTGGDDLRCGASGILDVQLDDGSFWSDDVFDQHLEPYRGFPGPSVFTRPIALPDGAEPGDVASIGISLVQGACDVGTTSDNWNIDGLKVYVPDQSVHVLVDRGGWPLIRLSESDPEIALPAEDFADGPLRTTKGRFARITTKTYTDDVQDDAFVNATLAWGGPNPGLVSLSLNDGAKWGDGATTWRVVDLGAEVDAYDLQSLTLQFGGQEDDWKFAELRIDLLGGPIGAWNEELDEALRVLGERGVAFGTDLNGLAPQVPFSEVDLTYPLDLPGAPASYVPLPQQQLANRAFDFQVDGLSNYGALPDFLAALEADDPAQADDTAPLFHSAADFAEMWAAVESAAAAVP